MAPQVRCAVCGGGGFDARRPLRMGGWRVAEGMSLARWWITTEVGGCVICGHVQAVTPLTPGSVSAMYPSVPVDRNGLDRETFLARVGPGWHGRMFAFCQPELAVPGQLIADIGCGNGHEIAALHVNHGIPADRLVAIDFTDAPIPPPFRFLGADLNELALADRLIPGLDEPVGFAICQSVLEHVLDPRAVLRMILRHLAPGGHLCIDVPDAAETGPPDRAGDSVLIHPHHLHYFSVAALSAIALSSGFELVRTSREDGPDYPRILMLLRRPAPSGTRAAVEASLAHIDHRRDAAVALILSRSLRPGGVRLWGIGADFSQLLERSSDLRAALPDRRRVRLYDTVWHGHRVDGAEIADSALLEDPADTTPVIMVPMPAHVRAAMRAAAERGGFADRLADPYLDDGAPGPSVRSFKAS